MKYLVRKTKTSPNCKPCGGVVKDYWFVQMVPNDTVPTDGQRDFTSADQAFLFQTHANGRCSPPRCPYIAEHL